MVVFQRLVGILAMALLFATYFIAQDTMAKGGHGGGGHHGGSRHSSHHHHHFHPSHHHASHHHSSHHHSDHHYAHHHQGWHHGSWGPGFWGGTAAGYGLGMAYANWGGWGSGGAGSTYVDNSTNVTPAADDNDGDATASADTNSASAAQQTDPGFATDNWPELGIVTYAGEYGGQQGQVVMDIVPGSAADKAGLVPGDVILSFNGAAVPSADALDDAMNAANGNFEVKVWDARTGRTSDLTGALDPAAKAAPANDTNAAS